MVNGVVQPLQPLLNLIQIFIKMFSPVSSDADVFKIKWTNYEPGDKWRMWGHKTVVKHD